MLSRKIGTVQEIKKETKEIQELIVVIEGKESKAINYIPLSGKVVAGDELLLNTTAVELDLGTGGYHFVISKLKDNEGSQGKDGHMIKLRYTPLQLKVNMAEEDPKYEEVFNNFEGLEEIPVVCGNLHSMLSPFAASLKYLREDVKIVYIMTDGAALPLWFSNTVRELKEKNILDSVITVGNAFGGDLECMNIYTGLIAAKEILKADVVFVGMGPGIAGTGTKYGFSGIEQVNIIDSVQKLGGTPIVIPRVSFADKRERHYGISHHSLTVLGELSNSGCVVPVTDEYSPEKMDKISNQISEHDIDVKHDMVIVNGAEKTTKEALDKYGLKVSTMGRGIEEEPEFFYTAVASAIFVSDIVEEKKPY